MQLCVDFDEQQELSRDVPDDHAWPLFRIVESPHSSSLSPSFPSYQVK